MPTAAFDPYETTSAEARKWSKSRSSASRAVRLGGERRVALGELAGLGLPHDLLAAPVRRQALEEVVALDVARVVARRGVRRVEVGDRERRSGRGRRPRRGRCARARPGEDRGVERADRLAEERLEAHPQLAAPVVVARRRDREHAARLLPCRRETAARRSRSPRLPPIEPVDVRPRRVEEPVVLGREVQPVERRRDEVAVVERARADRVDARRARGARRRSRRAPRSSSPRTRRWSFATTARPGGLQPTSRPDDPASPENAARPRRGPSGRATAR